MRSNDEATSPSAPMDGQPFRLLVVDDADDMRTALVDLLVDLGFEVVGSAPDGEKAVAAVVELHPEVVLMDMRMPGMDGIEATRRIKALDEVIQVVILTAYDDPGLRASAELTGVTSYLVKGCGPSLIADVLRSAGELHRGLRRRSVEGVTRGRRP